MLHISHFSHVFVIVVLHAVLRPITIIEKQVNWGFWKPLPKCGFKLPCIYGCDWNHWGLSFEDAAGRRFHLTLYFMFFSFRFLICIVFFCFPFLFFLMWNLNANQTFSLFRFRTSLFMKNTNFKIKLTSSPFCNRLPLHNADQWCNWYYFSMDCQSIINLCDIYKWWKLGWESGVFTKYRVYSRKPDKGSWDLPRNHENSLAFWE